MILKRESLLILRGNAVQKAGDTYSHYKGKSLFLIESKCIMQGSGDKVKAKIGRTCKSERIYNQEDKKVAVIIRQAVKKSNYTT